MDWGNAAEWEKALIIGWGAGIFWLLWTIQQDVRLQRVIVARAIIDFRKRFLPDADD